MQHEPRRKYLPASIISVALLLGCAAAWAQTSSQNPDFNSTVAREMSNFYPGASKDSINTPAPSQAIAAGFTKLSFADNFDYNDLSFLAFHGAPGHKWNAALWYKPNSASPQNFMVRDSVLSIYNNSISTIQNSPPFPGTTWLGGYFEARLYCTGHCGFYLASYKWSQLSGEACTRRPWCDADRAAGDEVNRLYGGADEIDIIEGYQNKPFMGQFTVHKSGSGAGQQGFGPPDQTNKDTFVRFGVPIVGNWHVYGLLWTRNQLNWYVDNRLVKTEPAFPSSWQPSFLVSSANVDKAADAQGIPDPAITAVDWVRVWERN